MAKSPGKACVNRIVGLAVSPPNVPAITTQTKKKTFTSRRPAKRPHARPAAMKPLYSPWFIARTLEEADTSGDIPKIFRPTSWSQKNISKTRMPRWERATSPVKRLAMSFRKMGEFLYGAFAACCLAHRGWSNAVFSQCWSKAEWGAAF